MDTEVSATEMDFQEAWWCHYHAEIHIGTENDWTEDHRSDMDPLYTQVDVNRARASR